MNKNRLYTLAQIYFLTWFVLNNLTEGNSQIHILLPIALVHLIRGKIQK